MTVRRTKGITTKVTEEEYAVLERLAAGDTLSEWARGVLLRAAAPPEGSLILAELLALRSIVLNLLYRIGRGAPVSAADMQQLIDRADADKLRRAHERLSGAEEGADA